MTQLKKQQSGFTLVEIAIVLVIIGLLLGGVLKGQELINSAKVKNMIGDFRTVSSLVYAYQDRFKSFPGDQNQNQLNDAFGANAVGGKPPTACTPAAAGHCTQNNGRIDGTWDATSKDLGSGTSTDESSIFWQHVRLANLATGPTDLADPNYRPRNADGGFIGIEMAGKTPYINGMRGSFFVCSAGVLGRYVKQIDTTMDDGNTAGGSVQATDATRGDAGAAAVATKDIVDGTQYTVCASY
ncbi:MAG: prepilin-type N-terminal cleavage/methylation domain-containing protein [Candidatus Accumulibacter sp.]|uniref:Prepilin-type N-terminal cleavage/methylation domain-containing protein n=2 Tax=Candidatus Accumulibacter TaxID=327159 RepID=A0A935Q4E5_9PROT|nr:prepilin-type N-terminal cleavage/methylation domain-containing protein [Accumulibacter sp.]MBK7676890.1 prepilin-type N-terminal cleavage/methylation domain-containing protein [Candidatus Accumulibacter proximus]MBL8375245.1 prepilin-type N-terminal cleavage/methylation domain-containing protein [Accumulibacter sp.]